MIVAHFTDIESARSILEGSGLRFSRLPDLNDPYENCQKMPSVGGSLDEMAEIDTHEHFSEQYHIYDRCIRLACFSMPYLTNVNPSFSAALNMSMWAHYSEKKTRSFEAYKGVDSGLSTTPVYETKDEQLPGVVLLIDMKSLMKKISEGPFQLLQAGPVSYHHLDSILLRADNRCPAVVGYEQVKRELSAIAKKCWFRKSLDWCYERECRVMVFDERECESSVDVSDSLVGIVTQQQFTAKGARFCWRDSDQKFLKRYQDRRYELFYDPINRYHKITLDGNELSDFPNPFRSTYYPVPEFPSI